MDIGMDEQLCQQQHRWFLQLQSGEEITLTPTPTPRANEHLCVTVTDVFLVDPESAASQGVVAACVEMGTRNIMLAQLWSESTHVELQTPVVLDEEFCLYVMRPGGDTDADTHTGAGATVVQFEGFVTLPVPSPDTDKDLEEEEAAAGSEADDEKIEDDYNKEDSESDREVDVDTAIDTNTEEVASSEDDDDRIDEDYEEDSESDGEVDVDEGKTTTAGGNAKDVGKVAARAFLGLFLFSYMVGFFRLLM